VQFIWQFRYCNQSSLHRWKSFAILHPDNLNRNSGPDFSEARIKINETLWVGNIELHINASHGHRHKHSSDKNYNNTILHVVWMNDKVILDNHQPLITRELQALVPKITLQHFTHLMQPVMKPLRYCLACFKGNWLVKLERKTNYSTLAGEIKLDNAMALWLQ